MASIEKLTQAKQYSSVALKSNIENTSNIYGISSPQKNPGLREVKSSFIKTKVEDDSYSTLVVEDNEI